ncbi:hypothetical protein [Lentilactobacillus kisonensis]|nr:hypothetical protein [Lentilactobacillus kisonensis]
MNKFIAHSNDEIIRDLQNNVPTGKVNTNTDLLQKVENDQYGVKLADGLPLA